MAAALKTLLTQKSVLFKIGLAVCALWLLVMIFAPLVIPYDPLAQDLSVTFEPPSAEHIFGTDDFGRDVFSRVLMASRISITSGLITVLVAMVIGGLYGGIAGYAGGYVDELMMRASELVVAFPPLILAMVIAAALGPSISNSIIAMAIIWWPNYARLMRSMVISLKENEYILAARALGASNFRIFFKEILPNSIGPVLIMGTLDIGNAILMFSGLSFLGLGTQRPQPEWGLMVSDGASNFSYWWLATFPGLAIFTVSAGANFLGDGLRDYLDPKLRNAL